MKQVRIMDALLDSMEIPYFELTPDTPDAAAVIARACARMRDASAPVALLVRKGTFEKYKLKKDVVTDYPMNREDAIKCLVDLLDEKDIIVSTTGKTSRELYEYREARSEGHGNDFLTVGSMGHTASIAMGVAQGQSSRRVICLDGDGSAIMHMGALAIIGQSGLRNLIHVIINNGAHDSVGGQPTVGFATDLAAIAQGCGYARVQSVFRKADIAPALEGLSGIVGPGLLEIRVRKGARADLGRPKSTPVENRDMLMARLSG
jgi:phosphonopyruvate decarboxylase